MSKVDGAEKSAVEKWALPQVSRDILSTELSHIMVPDKIMLSALMDEQVVEQVLPCADIVLSTRNAHLSPLNEFLTCVPYNPFGYIV